jgi:ABC-type lipopolysaccharide export system ATPase subunit
MYISLTPQGSTPPSRLPRSMSIAPLATTISARALTRRFGAHTAVNALDLELGRGEVLGFLGPNGAGKTTTMQMLTGNLAPTEGEVTICGFDLLANPIAAKAKIGYLPEHPPLYRESRTDVRLIPGTRGEAASCGQTQAP